MATYVISDIHGEYGKFMELLDMIHFSDEDILYVLGDVVDRGKNPVKTLLKMMEMPNVIPIAGNHEQMMLECMSVLIKEVKDENSVKEFAEKFSDDMFQKLYAWQRNGGIATTDELSKLDNETRKDVLDYVADFHGTRRWMLMDRGIFLCMEDLAISILRGILMIIRLMNLYGQGWIMMSDILMM